MRLQASIGATALLICSAPLSASADSIAPEQAHAVVDAELSLVSKNYVFTEKRTAIVTAIRAKEKAGAYDLQNPAALADKLGGDVIAASSDKHMWIQYDPAQYTAVKAPAADPHDAAYFSDLFRRENYGYKDMRVLPANIRYVNLTTFNWDAKNSPQVVASAARFLADGDAAIIDLRDNGGGSGDAVHALISYFMPAKRQELMAYHDGTTGEIKYSYVDLKLSAPRMVGKLLYVLTSGNTGSAAEEFAYHVKMFRLGTLVGETTAGAANNDTIYPIPPGFLASISTGRAIHPVNHGNWQGVGVVPDVAVVADKALEKAELLALDTLSHKPGANAKDYEWTMTALRARVVPPHLSEAALAAYAGTYGIRTIILTGGQLVFQREGRPPKTMSPLAADLFTVGDDDQTRLAFHRAGDRIVGFDMVTADNQVVAVERSD